MVKSGVNTPLAKWRRLLAAQRFIAQAEIGLGPGAKVCFGDLTL